jgi:hypothetical protein
LNDVIDVMYDEVNDLLSTTDDKELKDGIYSLNDLYLEKKL